MKRPLPSLARLPHAWLAEARASLDLSSQLLLGQVSLMLMPVMDLLTLAPLGAPALAAAGLLNSITALLLLFCFGVMQAMAPLAGAALGTASGPALARQILGHGLTLSTALGLLAALAMQAFLLTLPALGQDPAVTQLAAACGPTLSGALLPAAWLCAWRVGYPLLGQARPLARILLACALLHGLANVLLVHGWQPHEGLGIQGLGWSYLISYGFAAAALAWHDRQTTVPTTPSASTPRTDATTAQRWVLRLLSIGLPIGAVMAIEYTLFAGSTLLMGRHGSVALAAHAVCLQWVTLSFIIPLAMSNTVLTRLSLALGKADPAEIHRVVVVACAIAAAFHAVMGACCLLMPEQMAHWMLPAASPDRAAMLELAVPMLQLAGLLQTFNGMSVVLAAVLRACRDTRAPLLQVFAGYWIAGLGSAWLLAQTQGPLGIWQGMCIGFGLTFVVLLRRVRQRLVHLTDLLPQPESAHAQSR